MSEMLFAVILTVSEVFVIILCRLKLMLWVLGVLLQTTSMIHYVCVFVA